MGDLADALDATERLKPGPPCSVATAVESLDDDDRRALLGALAGPPSAPQIQRALESVGIKPPSDGMIGRHRRRRCGCDGREWDGLTGVRA